jgi:choline monooxygenase
MTETPVARDSQSHAHEAGSAGMSDTLALEIDRALRRDWIAVARTSDISATGDYRALEILGEPIVVVRGTDGQVRALSNVCRHRLSTLVEGAGRSSRLVCPYHRWTYDLTGALIGAPCMESAHGFDKSQLALPEFPVEIWQGWIFVALGARPLSIAMRLAPINAQLSERGVADWITVGSLHYPSPWNWKLMVENFSESYHHLAVHTETLNPRWPAADSHGMATNGWYSELRHTVDPKDGTFTVFTAFPCFAFSLQDPAPVIFWPRMIVRDEAYFDLWMDIIVPPAVAEDKAAVEELSAIIDTIHREDIPMMERAERGSKARAALPGPLSSLEQPLRLFRAYLDKQMADA